MAISLVGVGAAASTAASTSVAIPYPAGIQANDLLLPLLCVSTVNVPGTPANYNGATSGNAGGSSPTAWVAWKLATGSESGSLTVSTSNVTRQAYMTVWRGVDPTTPFDVAVSKYQSSAANTAFTIPGVTATMAGCAFIYLGAANIASGTWSPPTTPSGFTENIDSVVVIPGYTWGYALSKGPTDTQNWDLQKLAAGIRGAALGIVLRPIPDPPTLTQASYRFYADGTESGSIALAAQDTAYTADLASGDMNLLVRIRLQSTNATNLASTDDWTLQWEKNASGTWTNVGSVLASSYETTNSFASMNGSGVIEAGETFLGTGVPLTAASFHLGTGGGVSGTLSAKIYASSGPLGSGVPTGAALATSTGSMAASALTATQTWYDFAFDGSFTPVAGTPYVIVLVNTVAAQAVRMSVDTTATTYAGQGSMYNGTSWTAQAFDFIFRIYGPGATVAPYNSANLTDGAATTNLLGAGTNSFAAGEVSETGTVTDLGWTGNNYSEVLYSLTLKSADLTDADTLRFRVVRNAATTGMTYTQTPTVNISEVTAPPSDATGLWGVPR